ncbi:MAG TPA: LLM class F420-dependent oxidoreductase [Candidatus Tectomicrobia bacterium]|nr:LLM class F420-dependent oxidoreductase [Candidatus Tectomicrobia bacterium]
MKIGVNARVSSRSLDIALVAQKAESLGFDSLWLPEHGVMPVHVTTRYQGSPDGSIPPSMSDIGDPFIGLARASAVTKTLKLGTGVCLVPERNPLLLAKEIATLDRLSGGRFVFGLGAGWLREETEILGGDFAHRWSQTREAVLVMKELWTKDVAEFHGKFYNFPPVRSFPKPFQTPHPPIFLGGSAQNVFKRVVAWGDGWMPTRATPEDVKRGRATLDELAAAAGRDPHAIDIMVYGETADRDVIKRFEDAGASGMTVRLATTEGEAALIELERMAKQLLS